MLDAALVLARLGYTPVIHASARACWAISTYGDDAQEALYAFDTPSVLPKLNARLDARRSGVRQYVAPTAGCAALPGGARR